jgi:chemotaxis methyl-accepting protein methylase
MNDTRALETVADRVADLLLQRVGLRPDTTLRGRLHRAIRDEASRRDEDPDAYLERLVVDGEALQGLMNRVTVQETGFFRHPDQFELLAREVLPTTSRPLRIWSAGCANGQEAYSLAMVLEERGIDGTVVATDLSTAALRRTQVGRYTDRELSGMSPERLSRHFVRTGDEWEVAPPVRGRVRTLHHNLLDPIPPEVRSCEVVFCRNVLIYLSPQQARAFLERLAEALSPNTTLFAGAAETIWQFSDRFAAVHVGNTFMYRPRPSRTRSLVSRPGDRRRHAIEETTPRRTTRPPRLTESEVGPRPEIEPAALLERVAQDAFAAGEVEAAVVAFRKCAYLRPHDPVAQLHLGLALEAAGDARAAKRAFAAARRALADTGPEHRLDGLEGYAPAELLRLLDSKA